MKTKTKSLMLGGAVVVLLVQAFAGGNHFHAKCAFDKCARQESVVSARNSNYNSASEF